MENQNNEKINPSERVTTIAISQESSNEKQPRAESPDSPPGGQRPPLRHTTSSRAHLFHSSDPNVKGLIAADGESGRKGVHPFQFLYICYRSSCTVSQCVNLLWPAVPAAIVCRYVIPDSAIVVFVLAYLGMVPAANMIGFAGSELARKIHSKPLGVLVETTLGSIVEIVLLIVLITNDNVSFVVVRAAILGSILANLLLCLGACFIAGGWNRQDQALDEAISETGNGMLLMAAMGLVTPAAFATLLINDSTTVRGTLVNEIFESIMLKVSRGTAILLLIAFVIYTIFQMTTYHSVFDNIFNADEELDRVTHRGKPRKKLTFIECCIALSVSVAMVALMAIFLVQYIDPLVTQHGISEAFMGLILVPVVEKAAEHLTAVDEAWSNQSNSALAHVLGASIQTALLNTPIAVIVAWALGKELDLNFRQFEAIMLILAIIVVGNFLKDGKSNYLEGSLCIIAYVIIAVCAFFYPTTDAEAGEAGTGVVGGAVTTITNTIGSEVFTSTMTATADLLATTTAEVARRAVRNLVA